MHATKFNKRASCILPQHKQHIACVLHDNNNMFHSTRNKSVEVEVKGLGHGKELSLHFLIVNTYCCI